MSLLDDIAPYARYVAHVKSFDPDRPWQLIDRRTIYGNPFVMRENTDAERTRVIEAFDWHLRDLPESMLGPMLANIREVLEQGGQLLCWCAPRPCHGQVWAKWALSEDL